jgi:hypothetical protein
MLEKMLEVKHDKELKKYIVSPVGTDIQEDYLIECNSEFDAKSLCAQISMQMIPSPTDNPLNYTSKGMHPNGHTRIFRIKETL